MLLADRAFFPNTQAAERTKLVVIPSYTDNRGQRSAPEQADVQQVPALSTPDGVQCAAAAFRSTSRREVGRRIAKQIAWQTETPRDSTPHFVFVFFRLLTGGSFSTRRLSSVRQQRTRSGSIRQKQGRGGRSRASARSPRTGFD